MNAKKLQDLNVDQVSGKKTNCDINFKNLVNSRPGRARSLITQFQEQQFVGCISRFNGCNCFNVPNYCLTTTLSDTISCTFTLPSAAAAAALL